MIYVEQLNEFMTQYEESNLKAYAGTKYDDFMLFKHPHKT